MRNKHRSGRGAGHTVNRSRPVLLAAALLLGAGLLTAAIWFLATPEEGPVQASMVSPELRERTAVLVEHARSIRLTPERERVKREALASMPALGPIWH